MIFALIARKPASIHQRKLNNGYWTNNAEWETWADDEFTFPEKETMPVWERRSMMPKRLSKAPILQLLGIGSPHQAHLELVQIPPIIPQTSSGGDEEVRRNEQAFHSITTKGLWYQKGIQRYAASQKPLKFSKGSIEIKAVWVKEDEGVPQDVPYHFNWALGSDNKLAKYRLVGLHIMTNALPEWTWSTFEWAGYGGRCNYNGCKDTFGALPSYVGPPIASPHANNNVPLIPTLTAGAQDILEHLHVGHEWSGYRLTGSQVLVDGAHPTPPKLGNYAIEGGRVRTASCLSCHQRARVKVKDGSPDCDLGFIDSSHTVGSTKYLSPQDLTAFNAPDYYSTGFIWAFLKADKSNACTQASR